MAIRKYSRSRSKRTNITHTRKQKTKVQNGSSRTVYSTPNVPITHIDIAKCPVKYRGKYIIKNNIHNLIADLDKQTADTIEKYTNDIRIYYDKIKKIKERLERPRHRIQYIDDINDYNTCLSEIERFENTKLSAKMDELLS